MLVAGLHANLAKRADGFLTCHDLLLLWMLVPAECHLAIGILQRLIGFLNLLKAQLCTINVFRVLVRVMQQCELAVLPPDLLFGCRVWQPQGGKVLRQVRPHFDVDLGAALLPLEVQPQLQLRWLGLCLSAVRRFCLARGFGKGADALQSAQPAHRTNSHLLLRFRWCRCFSKRRSAAVELGGPARRLHRHPVGTAQVKSHHWLHNWRCHSWCIIDLHSCEWCL
mmetsp:Transcript_47611/g.132420  ORF Transcript_47611/g.132420 Transcript_47611/m.132420 type:complete len:224 (-) Transcript_47611:109-780(-)